MVKSLIKIMELKIGDKVKWSSQAQGCETTKEGKVVGIVKEKTDPLQIFTPLEQTGNYTSAYGGGMSRNHKSYIIAVKGKTDKSKEKLYWPNVSKLKKI